MSGGSIRFRLLIAAAASLIVAVAIAGIGLTTLFERHIERLVERDLNGYLNQLIAGIEISPGGTMSVAQPPSDPRFLVPLSGLYWQVTDIGSGATSRSRSLWDTTLVLPASGTSSGMPRFSEIAGPADALLIALDRTVKDQTSGAEHDLRVVVAEDHRTVANAAKSFAFDLVPALALFALLLIAAAWVQIAIGLRPLERMRRAVAEIISGEATRLDPQVPDEVRPLVGEINRLLEAQAKALARARTRAADLAHGLKTPLQVLSGDIRALREKGDAKIADEIDRVAGSIRRHVDRELAGARAASDSNASTARSHAAEVAERVIGVVRRTPRGSTVAFVNDIGDGDGEPADGGGRLPRALRRAQGVELRPARAGALRGGVLHHRQDRLHPGLTVPGRIRIGVGGWVFEPWRGAFFPEGLAQSEELDYASRQLTSIEINGTYYGSQKPASFRKWHDETPDDFVFAVKGPRFATNRKVLAEAGPSIERFFASGVMELKDKLGPVNWQFMATKRFDPDDFAAFLELLPREVDGRRDPPRRRGPPRELPGARLRRAGARARRRGHRSTRTRTFRRSPT